MPVFELQIKADLDGITSLGCKTEYTLEVTCSSCDTPHDKEVFINADEQMTRPNHRNPSNLFLKCKFCDRDNTMDIIPLRTSAHYVVENSGDYQTIAQFDSRGLVPTKFFPRGGWSAHGAESSTVFPEIDLSEGDWTDFDEQAAISVGIYNFESRFVKV